MVTNVTPLIAYLLPWFTPFGVKCSLIFTYAKSSGKFSYSIWCKILNLRLCTWQQNYFHHLLEWTFYIYQISFIIEILHDSHVCQVVNDVILSWHKILMLTPLNELRKIPPPPVSIKGLLLPPDLGEIRLILWVFYE